ncbi:unnamed protein product [Linum tenue]|uniref:Major facilitator superfamily (MFS) profile domain-containing protein n=1 Tax=Linum tenue TaxID=586396 RepID=A0AAV0GQH5_9ROSI|nr:unnamed protein product [Linum tenue]
MAASTKKFTILLCVVASQATLLYSFGYYTVVVLLSSTTTMEEDLGMTESQGNHFRSDTRWTFFFACFISGFVADFLGRRSTLILSGTLAFVGFLVISLAVSYGVLITGRILSLVGIGLGLPVAPLYIGEVASPSLRGRLNTIPEILSVLGLWLGVLTRAAVRDLPATSQWRVMVGMGIIPSLILGVGMIFLPESPCWLVRRARVRDAKIALQRTLKTTEEVEARLLGLRKAARIPPTMGDENFDALAQDIHVLAIWQELRRPLVRPQLKKLLISVFTIQCLQPMSGVDLLTYESLMRYPHNGPGTPVEFVMEELLPLCGRLLPISAPLFLSDVIGRTPLVRHSLGAAGISMVFICTTTTMLNYEISSRVVKELKRWSTIAFFGSFSFGLGPMTMVHSSEALPFKVRAQVIGIAVMVNRLLSFGLYCLKPALDRVFESLIYWIINLGFLFGLWLCGRYIIETSNESLEVLDNDFRPTLELSLGPLAT